MQHPVIRLPHAHHLPITSSYFANAYGYVHRYWAFKNAWSVDNIPGMKAGLKTGSEEGIAPMKKMVGLPPPQGHQGVAGQRFTFIQLIFAMLLGASTSAVLILFAGYVLPDYFPGALT